MGLGYKPTLPTIEQLNSSGNLRFIGNRMVVSKIIDYEAFNSQRLGTITKASTTRPIKSMRLKMSPANTLILMLAG
jgi:hypothetical protein